MAPLVSRDGVDPSHVNLGAPVKRRFFERAPDEVAHDLIGSWLVLHDDGGPRRAMIVETEAYGGSDDPASHSYRGPTKRSQIMFGPPGYLYVYLIYGVHWCMNVVTGPEGRASAVLLRGAELFESRNDDGGRVALRGPGNLTRGLGITGTDNGLDCCGGVGRSITIHRPRGIDHSALTRQSVRIGITREIDRPSRYFLDGDAAVSKMPTPRTPRAPRPQS